MTQTATVAEQIQELEKRKEAASYQRKITTQLYTAIEYDSEIEQLNMQIEELKKQQQQPELFNLESFHESARRAYYWNSFNPDRAAQNLISDYSEILKSDIEELQAAGAESDTVTSYAERFKKYLSAYISAKSRTASPMITGPAKFPTARNEKARRSEERHYEVFNEWRARTKKGIARKAQPEKTFSSELERYRSELESMKANHELMKQGNQVIKQHRKKGTDPAADLQKLMPNISAFDLQWAAKWGFGLQNNLANIKRVEERIAIIEKKQQNAATVGSSTQQYNGFTVTINHEADRIQIKHDTKPDASTIAELKKHGFKWAPSAQCWQRQLTANAMYTLKNFLLPKLTK